MAPRSRQEFYHCAGCRREYASDAGCGYDFRTDATPPTWQCFKCDKDVPYEQFECPHCGYRLEAGRAWWR